VPTRRLLFFMKGFRSIIVGFAVFFFACATFAHDPGLSSARIRRNGQDLSVELALAWSDLASILPSGKAPARPDPDQLQALGAAISHAVGGFVEVSASHKPLNTPAPVFSLGSAGANEVLISLTWTSPPPDPLAFDFPILASLPFGHRLMLALGSEGEPVALLDARHRTWELVLEKERSPAAAVSAVTASPTLFVRLGIEHILAGFDHLCFLFALLLVTARSREVLAVITTFTAAHSRTLAAAALGVVSLTPKLVEPLIAASIVYVGMENFLLRRRPRSRLVVVFVFGLIHGLGFAGGLIERLPGVTGVAIVPPLIGFNAGVELGQLAVAACLVPLIAWARRRRDFSLRLQPAGSLLIAGAGVVWLVQRV